MLPGDLLDRPAPEGARLIALAHLRTLARTRRRLADRDDTDALHDFRVALRRLRSVLRAYRAVLDDSVPRGVRRRLAQLAEAAGVCRDAQVRLAWLAANRARFSAPDRAGIAWAERQLRSEQRAAGRVLAREIAAQFDDVTARLRRRLMQYRVSISPRAFRAIPSTRTAMARTAGRLADELVRALDAAATGADPGALHLARIATKRMRYALEPLAEGRLASPGIAMFAETAVAQFASFQDELGRFNDAHLFRRWVRDRVAANPPARRALLRAQLRGLQHRLALEIAASQAALEDRRNRVRIRHLLRSVRAAARQMVPHAQPGDTLRS